MASLMEQYEQVAKSKSPTPGASTPSSSLGVGSNQQQQPVGVSGFVKLQVQDEQVSSDLTTIRVIILNGAGP